jgi:ABC-type uncharacterized transport system ATPase subunit
LLETVRQFASTGAAVVLVTHKLHEVKHCASGHDRARRGPQCPLDPRAATGQVDQLTVGTVPCWPEGRYGRPGSATLPDGR